jgi:hypothetical protein
MEIEKIQKLNQLAQDLKKYKVASADDAMKQAEQVYGERNNFVSRHTDGNEGMEMDNELNDLKKDVRSISNAVKRSEEQIQEIIKKMNEMILEINSVKAMRAQAPRAEGSQQKPQQQQQGQQEEAQGQTAADDRRGTKDIAKPIDRNNVAPKEVSIEKYFYFGKK